MGSHTTQLNTLTMATLNSMGLNEVGRDVKEFLHREGIHSTTVQLEYHLNRSGDCVLACPSDTSGQTNPDCVEASCCRQRPGSGAFANLGLVEDCDYVVKL